MELHDARVSLSALVGVLALVLLSKRLLQPGSRWRPAMAGRITVLESRAIDTRRRLVLVRLDGREFLLLTGGANDVLIAGDAT